MRGRKAPSSSSKLWEEVCNNVCKLVCFFVIQPKHEVKIQNHISSRLNHTFKYVFMVVIYRMLQDVLRLLFIRGIVPQSTLSESDEWFSTRRSPSSPSPSNVLGYETKQWPPGDAFLHL